jgi:hypothetical protein
MQKVQGRSAAKNGATDRGQKVAPKPRRPCRKCRDLYRRLQALRARKQPTPGPSPPDAADVRCRRHTGRLSSPCRPTLRRTPCQSWRRHCRLPCCKKFRGWVWGSSASCVRRGFGVPERIHEMRAMYDEQAKQRQRQSGGDRKSAKAGSVVANLPQPIPDAGKARDQVARLVGVSSKSIDHREPHP